MGRVGNIVGKKENAVYQPFLIFPLFSKAFFTRVVKSLDHGKGLTHSHTMTPFDAPGKQAF